MGINPGKKAFPKSSLPTTSFLSHPFIFPPSFVCAANLNVENSVVHCIAAHPSYTKVQHSGIRQ